MKVVKTCGNLLNPSFWTNPALIQFLHSCNSTGHGSIFLMFGYVEFGYIIYWRIRRWWVPIEAQVSGVASLFGGPIAGGLAGAVSGPSMN